MRPDLVRVRLANGSEVSHTRAWAERHGLEVLEGRPGVKRGRAVVDKPKISVAEAADRKQPTTPKGSDTPASNQEESK